MPVQNLFIISDLEGAHSVTRFSQTRRPVSALERARHLHTAQVNAMVRGIREFNPQIRVHLWDSHGNGGICRDDLDDVYAFLPHGWIHLADYFKSQKIDALFFESAHAMSRTPHANLCHTMSSQRVKRYVLNGHDVGEIGLRSAIAGSVNVPVLYLNGDDKACAEAQAIMPWIVTTTIKISTGLQTAKELPRDAIMATIASDVARALQQFPASRPYSILTPVQLAILLRWPYALMRKAKTLFMRSCREPLLFEAPSIITLVNKKIL
jgi:D-amino peptidase